MNVLSAAGLWWRTSFTAAPVAATVLCLTTIASGVFAPLSLVGISQMIGAATTGASLTSGLTLVTVSMALMAIAGGISGPLGDTVSDKLQRHVHVELITLVGSIPGVAHHEDPEVADRIQLIKEEVWKLGNIYRLLQTLVGLAAVATTAALLIGINPWLLLLILLALVPTSLQAWTRVAFLRVNKKNVHLYRAGSKLQEVLTQSDQGLEVRCFGMQLPLLTVIASALRRRGDANADLFTRFGRWIALGWVLFAAGFFWAVKFAVDQGRAGVLDVAAVSLLILLGPQIMSTAQIIASNFTMSAEILVAFDRYRWLRDYSCSHQWDESTRPIPDRIEQGITLSGVAFRYPSADGIKTALESVDLELPAGTSVALVGENGAGKSTLVKLLARLYDPTEGQILVDGLPLTELDPRAWRQRVSAGFQDFTKFNFTVGESIEVGDLSRSDDADLRDRAAQRGQGSQVVATLADGYQTQLGTQYEGGVDLSGGQWQRLALSRAFMRERPLLMLLDEPTAALDPEAEHVIYDQYAAAAKRLASETGAITVLVSHRFSTVRMADLIVVLEHGSIAEVGSHEELLAQGGHYAEMFDLQAGAYR